MPARGDEAAIPSSDRWLWVRLVLHIAFACLVTVWIVQPRHPSELFRSVFLAALALTVGIALWPRLRSPIAEFLHRRLRILDILVVNLVLLLAFSEAAVRVLAQVSDAPLLAPTNASSAERLRHNRGRPHGRYRNQRFNSLGLFDTEFEKERRPGVRRIVAMGDSFGTGVVLYEENFLTLLDDALDAASETEVLNFSVSAVGPPEYLYLHRTEARAYDPDLLLICFFIGNDFVRQKGNSILHPEVFLSLSVVKRLWAVTGEAPDIDRLEPDLPTFSEEAFREIEEGRLEFCRLDPDPDIREKIEQTLETLGKIHEELGDRLRVAIIPDEFQVNDALYASLVQGREREFDRELPNRLLTAFFQERGIAFLDLTEAIRTAEKTGPTYKLRDTHWNRLGNATAAATLANWLRASH